MHLQNFNIGQDHQAQMNNLLLHRHLQRPPQQGYQDSYCANAASLPPQEQAPLMRTEQTSPTEKKRSIPEFLYRLVTILEEDNDIIEWNDGDIVMRHPDRLETEVLARYFRTANLASFQRQLNYFGFHKGSGFGKFCPCTYTNPKTNNDIKSILTLKRIKPRQNKSAESRKKNASHTATVPEEVRLEPPADSLPTQGRIPQALLPQEHDNAMAAFAVAAEQQARQVHPVSREESLARMGISGLRAVTPELRALHWHPTPMENFHLGSPWGAVTPGELAYFRQSRGLGRW